jgi:hypothetical protein
VNGLILNGNTFSGLSTAAVWSKGVVKNVMITCNLCMDIGHKLAKKRACFDLTPKSVVLIKDNLEETPTSEP